MRTPTILLRCLDELLQQSCTGCGVPGLIVHRLDLSTRTIRLRCPQCGEQSRDHCYAAEVNEDYLQRLLDDVLAG
mgnify:CR=1 FL=1